MTFLMLQIVAVVNVLVSSAMALLAVSNPRRVAPAGAAGKRAGQSVQTFAYFGAVRTLILAAATLGAVALGSRQGFLWLAAVGAAILLFDSLPGQVKREPVWALVPLALGAMQIVLVATVVKTAPGLL